MGQSGLDPGFGQSGLDPVTRHARVTGGLHAAVDDVGQRLQRGDAVFGDGMAHALGLGVEIGQFDLLHQIAPGDLGLYDPKVAVPFGQGGAGFAVTTPFPGLHDPDSGFRLVEEIAVAGSQHTFRGEVQGRIGPPRRTVNALRTGIDTGIGSGEFRGFGEGSRQGFVQAQRGRLSALGHRTYGGHENLHRGQREQT